MRSILKIAILLIAVILLVYPFTLKLSSPSMILATTTSTDNSGLLAAILPDFEKTHGITVRVIAVGTGKALRMGRDGEADALLVHARSAEDQFMAEGHGSSRLDVMYNDFVVIGPKSAPAELDTTPVDIIHTFKKIHELKIPFVSRGDNSGTHMREKSLWEAAGITPTGPHYTSAGRSMGDVIMMADEMKACTLTDRGTWLFMKDKTDLKVIVQGDARLFNPYGVITVNPAKSKLIHAKEAELFAKWLTSEPTRQKIATYGVTKFGEALFKLQK
jgi:tungstate transport system substrate-binding protein